MVGNSILLFSLVKDVGNLDMIVMNLRTASKVIRYSITRETKRLHQLLGNKLAAWRKAHCKIGVETNLDELTSQPIMPDRRVQHRNCRVFSRADEVDQHRRHPS